MGNTWNAPDPLAASRTRSRRALRRGLWHAHNAQALRETLEQRRMAAGALGIVLDDDAERRIGFARQPDRAIGFEPELDVETDAPSVFAHVHDSPPSAPTGTGHHSRKRTMENR